MTILTPTGYMIPENRHLQGFLPTRSVLVRAGTYISQSKRYEVLDRDMGNTSPYPKVEELYKLWLTNDPKIRSYNYVREVLGVAAAVFGEDVEGFIDLQAANPFLPPVNREFLYDIARRLMGCRREMAIESYMPIIAPLDRHANQNQLGKYRMPTCLLELWKRRHQRRAQFSTGRGYEYTPLMRWASLEGGLDEIVRTLYVVIGHYPEPQ